MQRLVALLVSPAPVVAFYALNTMEAFLHLPIEQGMDLSSAGHQIDKKLCLELLGDQGVMDGLLDFTVCNVADSPSTDMEWAAVRGVAVCEYLQLASPLRTAIVVDSGMNVPRYNSLLIFQLP